MFFDNMSNKLFISFTKMASTYYKQKLVIAIVMSSVPPITIPMMIPAISPADSESSDATETVAVTETV